jgi:hypothetical protein
MTPGRLATATIGALLGLLTLSHGRPAAAFTELGDAPALPPGQTPSETPLLVIDGSFSGLGDVDLYRIEINDAASFAAETTAGPDADTVLFLFDLNGVAIAGNDDITGGNAVTQYWSRLAGVPGLVNGTYLLSISRWPYFPVSAGGQMIFSVDVSSEVLIPDQGVALPTGPGGAQPLTGWANAFGSDDPLQPAYSIALTGLPEPGDAARNAAVLAVLAFLGSARRVA